MFYHLYYLTVMGARWMDPAGRDLNVANSGFFTSGLAQQSLIALGNAAVWIGIAVHTCIGMALAMAYGFWAEPRLRGHGWQKGLFFAVPLFLLSLAFMPLMGIQLNALSVSYSLILHAIYGLLLGVLFGRAGDYRMSTDYPQTTGDVRESKIMERGAARGVLRGAGLGVVLAALLHVGFGSESLSILGYSVGWVYAATVIFCGSLGWLVGMVTSDPGRAMPTA
jgi:hypothetical protein